MASSSGSLRSPPSPVYPDSPNELSTEDDAPLLMGDGPFDEDGKTTETPKEDPTKSSGSEYKIAVYHFLVSFQV